MPFVHLSLELVHFTESVSLLSKDSRATAKTTGSKTAKLAKTPGEERIYFSEWKRLQLLWDPQTKSVNAAADGVETVESESTRRVSLSSGQRQEQESAAYLR